MAAPAAASNPPGRGRIFSPELEAFQNALSASKSRQQNLPVQRQIQP